MRKTLIAISLCIAAAFACKKKEEIPAPPPAAEIIVYAHVLTDQERGQVEDYLGRKYGVTVIR